eukprot:1284530-Rhodomonas_salina.1
MLILYPACAASDGRLGPPGGGGRERGQGPCWRPPAHPIRQSGGVCSYCALWWLSEVEPPGLSPSHRKTRERHARRGDPPPACAAPQEAAVDRRTESESPSWCTRVGIPRGYPGTREYLGCAHYDHRGYRESGDRVGQLPARNSYY